MRLALHARADLRLQTATTPHPGYCEGIGPPRGGDDQPQPNTRDGGVPRSPNGTSN
jgi:hypothetical protein